MTRHPHDQFAKALLTAVLEPLGTVTTQREVPAEALFIDVFFHGLADSLTPQEITLLGLLGHVLDGPCLFEPHRSELRRKHLISAMAKRCWVHLDLPRRRSAQELWPAGSPWMWVLAPRASAGLLATSGLAPALHHLGADSPLAVDGIYTLGPIWRLGVIVLRELPVRPDTLLLRLLADGATQLQAAREIAALPPDDPRRTTLLDLILKWHIFSTLTLQSEVVARAEMLSEIASAPAVTTEAGFTPAAGRSEDVSREFASSFARSRPEIA